MKQTQKAAWRLVDGGVQLYCSLWWFGSIRPSEQQENKWWWKCVLCDSSSDNDNVTNGYEDSFEAALIKVLECVKLDKNCEYNIVNGPHQYLDYLKELQKRLNLRIQLGKQPEYNI